MPNKNGKNDILYLRGTFQQKTGHGQPPIPSLRAKQPILADHIKTLIDSLNSLKNFWVKTDLINGALISATYWNVTPKTRRISALFSERGKEANKAVVGVSYKKNKFGLDCHVITYFISLICLKESIIFLQKAYSFTLSHEGKITENLFDKIMSGDVPSESTGLSKSKLTEIFSDCSNVVDFSLPECKTTINDDSIVSLYKTGITMTALLEKVGLPLENEQFLLDSITAILDPTRFNAIKKEAPYLIAMTDTDLSEIAPVVAPQKEKEAGFTIEAPSEQPIIGVFDTGFRNDVYFSSWVDYHECLPSGVVMTETDKVHGTEVDSIIVDGSSLNKEMDDGCGHFRVRHFGIATHGKISSRLVMDKIEKIVSTNLDIKVWNLSLGSPVEIEENFISPSAAKLDEIQNKYQVLFVISGTNDLSESGKKKIGSPADSINSLVVNSVRFSDGKPVSYHRNGPALSFFRKPDVSYYGGDYDRPIAVVYKPKCASFVVGTSFAAPWISRKLAFLIYTMKFSREIAKAMIIDSSINWQNKRTEEYYSEIGYGVVPIRIEKIIESNSDEIRFLLEGDSETKMTYTYNLPVPTEMGKYPFIAKATLCYFPSSSRNQGVDYTETELGFRIGRIFRDGKIKSISDQGTVREYEKSERYSRKEARKWDNTKHISQIQTAREKGIDVYNPPLWGIEVEANERIERDHPSLHFGIVVTLREIHGKNRISDFISLCQTRGWIVTSVPIKERIEIQATADQSINLE